MLLVELVWNIPFALLIESSTAWASFQVSYLRAGKKSTAVHRRHPLLRNADLAPRDFLLFVAMEHKYHCLRLYGVVQNYQHAPKQHQLGFCMAPHHDLRLFGSNFLLIERNSASISYGRCLKYGRRIYRPIGGFVVRSVPACRHVSGLFSPKKEAERK